MYMSLSFFRHLPSTILNAAQLVTSREEITEAQIQQARKKKPAGQPHRTKLDHAP